MSNYSFLDNSTGGPTNLLNETVKATNGVYPVGVLLVVFIAGIIALRRQGRDFDEILIYLGAFEFVLSGYMIISEWIAYYWLMFSVLVLATGLILNRLK